MKNFRVMETAVKYLHALNPAIVQIQCSPNKAVIKHIAPIRKSRISSMLMHILEIDSCLFFETDDKLIVIWDMKQEL